MFRITSEIALADGDVDERCVPLAASRSRKHIKEISGVELRLDILSASLPEEVKTRLLALRDRRVTSDGVLVVVQPRLCIAGTEPGGHAHQSDRHHSRRGDADPRTGHRLRASMRPGHHAPRADRTARSAAS